MKKRNIILIAILIAAGSFLAGSWITFQGSRTKPVERKILHYVDPMNPALKSDKPGIAPCGMPLEPVYADQSEDDVAADALRASLPPGTIRISPEKQQLIGVKTAPVEKAPWNHTLRVLGRVAPDETLVYRINTRIDSWIEKALPVTTGSQVKENELLATLSFFSLEYRTLVQNYFNLIALGGETPPVGIPNQPVYEQPKGTTEQKAPYSSAQLRQMRKATRASGDVTGDSQIDYYRSYLYNYGMSPHQVDEMERTRTFPSVIEVRAPAAGFVLYRNISPGLRLEKGAELFRIADLSRVWILADIFENEASYFRPGMRVRMELPYQKKTLYAEVSPVLPLFDPATRTLKVRLVAENPGFVMRPDMFVNVEFPVSGPPAIIVPVDAVLDSGLKKTVFVDRGNGFLEPRRVETARMLGDRVEISQGLMPGEKIVVSGNFLIDSEARMQQAASGIFGKIGRDPVCGMNIDEDRSKAEGNLLEYKGKTYFFCEPQCREDFRKDPERYLISSATTGSMPMAGSQDAAAVAKPRGEKSAPAAHGGMTMPAGKPPRVMPEKPTPSPKSGSKPGAGASPSVAAPGMGPQSPTLPRKGGMPMSMQQGTAPMPGPPGSGPVPGAKAGEMLTPAAVAPGMNQPPQSFSGPGSGSMPMPGPPGGATMPASPAGGMIPPAVVPGMGPGSPVLPDQGGMPGPTPQEAAPPSGAQTGEIAPPPARTPRINLRDQRYRQPGTAPQAGPQRGAPTPGSRGRGGIPPGATSLPGVESESQPLPPRGSVLPPGPPVAEPVLGTKSGETAPPATDTPEVKQ